MEDAVKLIAIGIIAAILAITIKKTNPELAVPVSYTHLTMIDPIAVHNLFGIEGLNIAWYAIIVTSGIVAGILLGGFLAKKKGYTFEMLIDLMLLALPMAIIFARLY